MGVDNYARRREMERAYKEHQEQFERGIVSQNCVDPAVQPPLIEHLNLLINRLESVESRANQIKEVVTGDGSVPCEQCESNEPYLPNQIYRLERTVSRLEDIVQNIHSRLI